MYPQSQGWGARWKGWGVASPNLNWIEPDHFDHFPLFSSFPILGSKWFFIYFQKTETYHGGGGGGGVQANLLLGHS